MLRCLSYSFKIMVRAGSLASVHLDTAEEPWEIPPGDPDRPFRILVAGNFSGGAGRIRTPVQIDRDNFDEVLSLFAPEVRLELAHEPVPVRFEELEDFHPDRLFLRLAPFRALRDLRLQVEDGMPLTPPAAPPPARSGADLLREMLGEPPASRAAAPPPSNWDRMLHELVAPYAEPKPDPRTPEYLAQVDRAITGEMRGVLHCSAFQNLEAAWRGLHFLVRRLDTDEHLKVYAWDVPAEEMFSAEGPALLGRVLIDEAAAVAGAARWSVVAGLYECGPAQEAALQAIASVAERANAPFVAGVAPDVVGLGRAFESLRRAQAAPWVALALPRFLLRLPYGAETSSAEEFAFEEMPSPCEHERYLWGNPAVACVCLLGETFSRRGWQMRPGEVNRIDGLPAHVYRDGRDAVLKPCAEVLLTDDSIELLLERGFLPLISVKDSDQVRVARFQSVAEPARPLAGPWDQA